MVYPVVGCIRAMSGQEESIEKKFNECGNLMLRRRIETISRMGLAQQQ